MSTTPGTEAGDSGSGNRRRWIVIAVIVVIVIGIAIAAGLWYYLYGGTAPDAPTIDDALQQLLPTDPPE